MDPTDNNSWVSGRTEQEALEKAAKSFGIKDLSTISLKQVSHVRKLIADAAGSTQSLSLIVSYFMMDLQTDID